MAKKVKICSKCSNIDPKKLKKKAKEIDCKVKVGCIDKCKKDHPQFDDTAHGMIDGKHVVCKSQKQFFKKMGA